MYKQQKMESRASQFTRLSRLWETMPKPEKDRIQELYDEYNRESGRKICDGLSLERAFIEVMAPPDRTSEAIDAAAEEYEQAILAQDLMGK